MANSLVSVLMPSLNQAQFLEVAVRSVLEQSYTPLEVVVADGMSTDGSVELLVRLQREYGVRLSWVSQKDTGPAQAINRALSMAQGDTIGWLNSDDIYMPDAVANAIEHLSRHPRHQWVYGEANHIGPSGDVLGRYPTRSATTPVAEFANGSFICQPTVFMRRSALEQVGNLDESLRLAFDFDLWLRLYKCFPRQVGMVKQIQACSRLHPACLTQRQRKQVALEGMKVLLKHISGVPEHWLWTHVDEMCATYPFDANPQSLIKQVESFLMESRAFYEPECWVGILARIRSDRRIELSKPGLFATVQPDGWVCQQVEVKYRWAGKPAPAILLTCIAAWPRPGRLRIKVRLPSGDVHTSEINAPADFVLRLEVNESTEAGQICWTIEAPQGFVPAKSDDASNDNRRLAFRVTSLECEGHAAQD